MMTRTDSPRSNVERSYAKPVVALAAAYQTVGLTMQKKTDGLYRLAIFDRISRRQRTAVPFEGSVVMVTPRSRRRITTRGFDLLAWKWAGGKPVKETSKQVETRSVEIRRGMAENLFKRPRWTIDMVLSWIGYRDAYAIDTPFAPAFYRDSRPVVESRPRVALLHALQRGDLRAVRQRGQLVDFMAAIEWFSVQEVWSIERWPDCFLARADVIGRWPEIAAVVEHEPAADAATSLADGKENGSDRLQRILAIANTIGTNIRNRLGKMTGRDAYPFKQEIERRLGSSITWDEEKAARKARPASKGGRPPRNPQEKSSD